MKIVVICSFCPSNILQLQCIMGLSPPPPLKRTFWISWAELLKRVFYDHLTKCEKCGHLLKIVDHFISIQEMKKFINGQVKERGPPTPIQI